MQTVILSVLALSLLQVLLPVNLRFLLPGAPQAERLAEALGARDQVTEDPMIVKRAVRASANLQETLPIFIGLALLHEVRGTGADAATWGWAYLGARAAYVPVYLAGIPGLRTALWFTSLIAMGGLASGLVG
jgi:uncharacterized MAPEG superfamily protein